MQRASKSRVSLNQTTLRIVLTALGEYCIDSCIISTFARQSEIKENATSQQVPGWTTQISHATRTTPKIVSTALGEYLKYKFARQSEIKEFATMQRASKSEGGLHKSHTPLEPHQELFRLHWESI